MLDFGHRGSIVTYAANNWSAGGMDYILFVGVCLKTAETLSRHP